MKKTVKYLLEVLEDQLSQKLISKYTMTDLIRSSGVKRGTIYYHFEDLNDVFDVYLETLITDRINVGSVDDQVKELINFISSKRILCLNLYRLVKTQKRRAYFLEVLNRSFQQYDLCNKEQGSYLVGGFLFILIEWFDNDLRESEQVILKKLLNYIEFVSVRDKV
ncbi:TetR family transcriptional regulator [Companilactobacillus baiquanensis]|uniref:TetR family transcriptional regulator n=1 Tax=Companilactobacillus baiquanensis TaxID=2486005 RepID=A0ABW1UW47_9LACO|nr:TetR family transcriptional regulator [Companilactobacillus baiquanensis]